MQTHESPFRLLFFCAASLVHMYWIAAVVCWSSFQNVQTCLIMPEEMNFSCPLDLCEPRKSPHFRCAVPLFLKISDCRMNEYWSARNVMHRIIATFKVVFPSAACRIMPLYCTVFQPCLGNIWTLYIQCYINLTTFDTLWSLSLIEPSEDHNVVELIFSYTSKFLCHLLPSIR